MKRLAAGIAALLTLSGTALPPGTSTSPPARQASGGAQATLYVFSDVRGYLEPCGCSEGMRGGISRAAALIRASEDSGHPPNGAGRANGVLVFDAGDSLLEGGRVTPDQEPEIKARSQTLARIFAQLGLTARAVGPRDDALGAEFRRSLKLPEVPSGEARLLTVDGHSVGWVSGTSLDSVRHGAEAARHQGAEFVLAAWSAPLEVVQKEAEPLANLVDVIVASHHEDLEGEESRLSRGAVPVAEVQSKGRSLLQIQLRFGEVPGKRFVIGTTADDLAKEASLLEQRQAMLEREANAAGVAPPRKAMLLEKIQELSRRRAALSSSSADAPANAPTFWLRFVPVESTLPKDPKVDIVVKDFDRKVEELNLAWAGAHGHDCPEPSAAEPGDVGTSVCATCHPGPTAVWLKSRHAHAYDTLRSVGKSLHTACVGCHVTGYGQAGGVCRLDRITGRENVGCESCHGPGSAHASAPSRANIIASPTEARCVTCHTHENSPRFDFGGYRPRILGPGHGAR